MDEKNLKISIYTSPLHLSLHDPPIMDRIRSRYPRVAVDIHTDEDSFLDGLPESDVALLQKEISEEISQRMEPLITASGRPRWIHWGYSGINRLAPLKPLHGRLLITTSKGLCSYMIADYVIMAIHMLHREFPSLMRNQMNRVWKQGPYLSVRGKTLGIIGLGNIGKDVARKAVVFGMRVIGMARREVSIENVDKMFLSRGLREFLGESDIVLISVPLTSKTRGLMGEKELGWMKPRSYLINVARGHILDEEALVEGIKRGHIAGAALDVFAQEPLPSESELWSLDNVIITPHTSGWTWDYPQRVLDLFCANLERFMEGKALTNTADMETGY